MYSKYIISNLLIMKYINLLSYLFYHKYRWSKASKIGPVSYNEYINLLGRENIVVSEDSDSKRIEWEDISTLYVFRFSKKGEFQIVEREVWYDYKWPSLSKLVILEVSRF